MNAIRFVSRILESSPYVEVLIRQIYWKTPWLISLANRKKINTTQPVSFTTPQTLEKIEEFLQNHGVVPGSLLVVHSSFNVFKSAYSPAQIIDRLLAMIGESGTLAMPAFPLCKGEPKGINRMTADVSDIELVYDVKRTLPWTGMLPLHLMRKPGSISSRHPLNSMVAFGPLAQAMMADNLTGSKPLPCGVNSTWKFCADHKAVIVALGVDMAHSLTMIHVAEDAYEDEWPVKEWYRERKYLVIDGEWQENVVVRERHPKWAMHYAERTLSKDLKRSGLMHGTIIDGIPVEVIDAASLLEFLNQLKSSAYPYFMIPMRNFKK